MSHNFWKRAFGKHVRPANIQINLRIRVVWLETSLGSFRIAKDAKFLQADNEDSDQTAQMRRLIWVFVGPRRSEGTFSPVAILIVLTVYLHKKLGY